jgi:hypothetical protein
LPVIAEVKTSWKHRKEVTSAEAAITESSCIRTPDEEKPT